jgi:hypothetical protein
MKLKVIAAAGVIALLMALGMGSVQADDLGVESVLSKVNVMGGISGGYFYTSNPGEDLSGSEFLLSNLLVEISSADEAFPIGFSAAFGQTATPSVLDAPEETGSLGIEYASVSLSPLKSLNLEVGLIGPNSGYEATYTYENMNILLGTVASQQPYNAYGVKVSYDVNGISFWGGYYRDRLDDEEYGSPEETWEIGISGTGLGAEFNLYHYHIDGFRNDTGIGIDRSFARIDIGLNLDYWKWDDDVSDNYGSDSSLGIAVYVRPVFGSFSLPFRFEYVDQGESMIYVESEDADRIMTITVTPTYNFNGNAYVRAEAAYVLADSAFANKKGDAEDCNLSLAAEIGFLF